jgi:hypothetical protein
MRGKIDTAVSVTVSFIGVRGWSPAFACRHQLHVRTVATADEQRRSDLETVRVDKDCLVSLS